MKIESGTFTVGNTFLVEISPSLHYQTNEMSFPRKEEIIPFCIVIIPSSIKAIKHKLRDYDKSYIVTPNSIGWLWTSEILP